MYFILFRSYYGFQIGSFFVDLLPLNSLTPACLHCPPLCQEYKPTSWIYQRNKLRNSQDTSSHILCIIFTNIKVWVYILFKQSYSDRPKVFPAYGSLAHRDAIGCDYVQYLLTTSRVPRWLSGLAGFASNHRLSPLCGFNTHDLQM